MNTALDINAPIRARLSSESTIKPDTIDKRCAQSVSTVVVAQLPVDVLPEYADELAIEAIGSKTVVLRLKESQRLHGMLFIPFVDSSRKEGFWVFRDGKLIYCSEAKSLKQAADDAHSDAIRSLCHQTPLF